MALDILKAGTPLSCMQLSGRAYSALYRAGIDTIEKLVRLSGEEIRSLHGVGASVAREIQFALNSTDMDSIAKAVASRREQAEQLPSEVKNMPVGSLDMDERTKNALRRAGIYTVGRMVQLSEMDIRLMRNVGEKGLREVLAAIHFYMEDPPEDSARQEDACSKEARDAERERRVQAVPEEVRSTSILEMHFAPVISFSLQERGVNTIGDLLRMSETDVMALRGVGAKRSSELLDAIHRILMGDMPHLPCTVPKP